MSDPVNHPQHYAHRSGIEAIDVAEHLGFNLGNAFKYVWRAGLKTEDPTQDLQKAQWHLTRQLDKRVPGRLPPIECITLMKTVTEEDGDAAQAYALQSIFDAQFGGYYMIRQAIDAVTALITRVEHAPNLERRRRMENFLDMENDMENGSEHSDLLERKIS